MAVKRRALGEPESGYDACALYVGDVPDTWKSEDIHELHRNSGLGEDGLAEVKILPKRLPGETTCAILRYGDAASASRAIAVLNGFPVETSSGQQKMIRARFAELQQQKGPKAARVNAGAPAPVAAAVAAFNRSWPKGGGVQPQVRPLGLVPAMLTNAPQHPTSVYLSEVPAEFTEQSLQAFHSSLGLGSLVGAKFLPRKISGLTGSVMLRYATPAAAQQAVLRLQGHPVNLSTGAVKYLIAKLADPPKGGSPVDELPVDVPSLPTGGSPPPEAPPAGCDPSSLYLADVPLALNEEAMVRLHQQSGLDAPASAKYLPQKLDGETCCVIVRYDNPEHAKRAIQVLHSISVKTQSGKQKFITARFASMKRSDGAEGGFEDGQGHWATAQNSSLQPYPAEWDPPATGGDDDYSMLPSAYVSDLPGNITEDGVRQLLSETGVDQSLMVCAKFLPRRIQANSICAILRCNDMSGVNDIVTALNGYQVLLPGGQTRHLVARVADPPRSGAKAGVAASPAVAEPTDLYMSEVPVEWTEDTIISVHTESGADPSTLSSVKLLQRRHTSYPTGSAILRYVDHTSAAMAMTLLQGRPVNVPGGQRQLSLRFADPPKKTREGGAGGRARP